MIRRLLPLLSVIVIFSSCVHHSPFNAGEYYFQAMGRDSEIVMTVDAGKAKATDAVALPDNAVTERAERLSVALDPETTAEEKYPLTVEDYTIYGAVEGNFGKTTTGIALSSMEGFDKVKSDSGTYYLSPGISVGVPENGLLLFSTGDYDEAYSRTVENREILIPYELSSLMASSLAAFYVKNPRTMLDLGFELPITVLKEMETAIIFIDKEENGFVMSANITMSSEKNAKTFTTLLKNNVVSEMLRKGEKLDFKQLSAMIYQDGQSAVVFRKPLSAEEAALYLGKAEGLFGGLL